MCPLKRLANFGVHRRLGARAAGMRHMQWGKPLHQSTCSRVSPCLDLLSFIVRETVTFAFRVLASDACVALPRLHLCNLSLIRGGVSGTERLVVLVCLMMRTL